MSAAGAGQPSGTPWPSSAVRRGDGGLVVAGVPTTALAEQHGTPLYVLDEGEFRTRARTFVAAFGQAFEQIGTGVDVYYAGKALLTKAVARWASEEGLRVDTATGGELAVALAAGVPGAHIGLHGNNKSDAELVAALDAGVGRIIVDSLGEIDRLARLAAQRGVVAPVMLRVTTGVHAGGHEFIATAHEDQKFGLSVTAGPDDGDPPAVLALLQILQEPSLRLLGIHSHIGSQILHASGFAEAARTVLRLRAHLKMRTGVLVDEVDLGGGYGIAYLPHDEELDPFGVAREIAQAVDEACTELDTALPRISIEPGRAVVGPAGITVYTVGTVKPVVVTGCDGSTFTRLYVAVDGGMSDNIRTALYGAEYHAEIAGRSSDAPPTLARVVGKHCESGDIVVHEVLLPEDVAPGDLLAVAATGAYGHSMASNYNLLTRPPVVAVSAGDSRVLVRRETVEDLLARDEG